MILLPITVRNKIATFTGDVPYICGNSDYKVVFTFDDEWDEHSHKTARFVYGSSCTDVLFEGNECSFPMIEETTMVVVGVYAGNLRTTTGASVRAILSIRSEHGSPESPKPDVYEQIMETLDGYDDRLEDVEKKLSSGGGVGTVKVSATRPETDDVGGLWFDTSTGKLRVCTSLTLPGIAGYPPVPNYTDAGAVSVSETAPSDATAGNVWYKPSSGVLYICVGRDVTVMPPSGVPIWASAGGKTEIIDGGETVTVKFGG